MPNSVQSPNIAQMSFLSRSKTSETLLILLHMVWLKTNKRCNYRNIFPVLAEVPTIINRLGNFENRSNTILWENIPALGLISHFGNILKNHVNVMFR